MDNLISLIKIFFSKKYNTGANLDERREDEKQKIYYHEEIATGAQYSVYGNKDDVVPGIAAKYQKENQRQTSSCMAHATALALGIDNELEGEGYTRLSPALLYRKRSNYPAEGMILDDVFEIARNIGTCTTKLLPTPKTEYEINNLAITKAMLGEAEIYKAKNHVNIRNFNNIDVLNSIASQGKAVVIMTYATKKEWAREYPVMFDSVSLTNAPIRHGVTVIPHSGFKDKTGKKYIMVQDSVPEWGGYHCLSEEWVANRLYGAGYPLNLENKPETIEKPKHAFTVPMGLGDENEEVKWLQKCLRYLGYFPDREPTGAFYGITLKAVKEFQTAYKEEILTPVGLELASGYVGHSSLRKLNDLFNN